MTEQYLVRTSERRDWMDCNQRWWWAYVEGLKSIDSKPALAFGDLIHQALAAYYIPGKKRGPYPVDTFLELFAEHGENLFGFKDENLDFNEPEELGCEMLANYVEWATPLDKHLEIIAPEQAFQVDIFDSETDDYLCTYVGQLDAVVRDHKSKRLGFLEHKTTKAIPPPYWLPMDEQAGSYWAFAPDWLRDQGWLGPNEDMDFILYNFLKKMKKDPRPTNELGQCLNGDGSVSKRQPGPLFHREMVYRNAEMRNAMITRVEWQVQMMKWQREGKLPVLKSPDGDCRWKCQFKDMCHLHEMGQDWEALRDAMFVRWKPYEAHDDVVAEEQR